MEIAVRIEETKERKKEEEKKLLDRNNSFVPVLITNVQVCSVHTVSEPEKRVF